MAEDEHASRPGLVPTDRRALDVLLAQPALQQYRDECLGARPERRYVTVVITPQERSQSTGALDRNRLTEVDRVCLLCCHTARACS